MSRGAGEGGTDTAPLAILHLCAPARVGGLERVVQALAVGAHGQGHSVAVLAVVDPKADVVAFLDPLRAQGVETVVIRVPGRDYLKEVRAIRSYLKRSRPDILHCHGYRSDILHGGTARRLGIGTVSTLHGSSLMGGATRFFEWLQTWSLRRFDAVVAVSGPLSDSLVQSGVPQAKIHHIPNAWAPPLSYAPRPDARNRLGAQDVDVLIGWVGRLIPVKGCDVFLHALTALAPGSWAARVVGDGPERGRLEALAQTLGISDRVEFVGAIPDAAHLFKALDIFVLSSRSEGTPMVLLEAMGAGVPVVATAVGGVPDVVPSRAEGWTPPPEDPTALAAALDEALADADDRSARGQAGQSRVVASFDTGAWIQAHISLYRGLIRRG